MPDDYPEDSSQPIDRIAPVFLHRGQQLDEPKGMGHAESQVPAEWRVGDVILGLYEVTGILGEGGMGKVYKVRHRGWNLELAVKSPRPQIFARSGALEDFIR